MPTIVTEVCSLSRKQRLIYNCIIYRYFYIKFVNMRRYVREVQCFSVIGGFVTITHAPWAGPMASLLSNL